MQNSWITSRWIHLCIGLVLVHSIAGDCLFPPKELPHGRFLFQELRDANKTTAPHNYLLRFRCFAGYTRIGPRAIICSEDQWSDVVPTCTRMRCSDPPKIKYGDSELHAGTNDVPTIGSTAVYHCSVGHEMLNKTASTLTCVFGRGSNTASWEGEMPECKERVSCPDPGLSKDGSREGHCCFSGDVLKFSCNEDYELVGHEEMECLPTGSWTSGRPLCRPLGDHCPIPPLVPHGAVTGHKDGDYYRPYDEVEVICKPGYSHQGESPLILCEEEGEWEMEFGECTEAFCDPPDVLENGVITELQFTNTTSFPFNFELTYVCDKGYRLVGGDSWRFCDTTGWSGRNPHCEVIKCPDPGVPDHGAREGDNFTIGSKIRFKCFTGYDLIGSFERYCRPNGQWTGELARCDTESNYCPDPGIPVNGYRNSTDYDMGSLVGFGCRPGYILLGSKTRVCQPNRTWSGKEATCLGPYDFDNSAQIRDNLKMAVSAKVAEQAKKMEAYRQALYMTFHNMTSYNGTFIGPMGRTIPLDHVGRLILYFIFDVSGSVGSDNFYKSIEFAKAIVKKVGVSPAGARSGAITFSSKAEMEFSPVEYTTTEEVLDALDKLNFTGGGTSASSALKLLRTEYIPIAQEVLGKKGQKSIVFILTDGRANMGGNPQEEANLLKEAGVEIYCIGITGDVKKSSLYDIASDSTKEQHVFILENYGTLAWLIQELTNGTVDYSQCGLGLESAGNRIPRGRIVGGKTSTEPWPWMAALYFLPHGTVDPTDAELRCGGSIIHRNFILTAAHCMYTAEKWLLRDAKEIMVKLGLTHVKNETFVQKPEVKRIHMHPQYKPGPKFDFDVALLQLSNPIEFSAHVRPICLPPKDVPPESELYKANEFGLTIGWGHTGIVPIPKSSFDVRDAIKMSDELKELIMPIQSRERCMQSLQDKIKLIPRPDLFTERMFCAGDGLQGNDTCHGDSGGPFMQSQLNEEGYLYWTQVGIVSWGMGCGNANTYGFYSHVQKLRQWIDRTIEDAVEEEIQ